MAGTDDGGASVDVRVLGVVGWNDEGLGGGAPAAGSAASEQGSESSLRGLV